MTEKIQKFRTVGELQKHLEGHINELKKSADEMSKIVGEKMRVNDSSNTPELQELRQNIEGSADPKKKKSTKKNDKKTNWHNLDSISVYDGVGVKGELELYFKAIEMTKAELDRATKVKQSLDDLVTKGLKRDMGCVMILNHELPAEISFTSSASSKKKYQFKAIFDVRIEEPYGIKN